MIMDNKGQIGIFALMLGLTIIILGLALAPAVAESVGNAGNATIGDTLGMDCNNSTISNFTKAACITSDLSIFYFVGGIILLAGGIIVARLVF